MGVPHFRDKGPHTSLWAALMASGETYSLTIIDVPNHLNYFVNCIA